MDAIRHEERTSPKWRLERMAEREARYRQLSVVYDTFVVLHGSKASPKLRAENKAKRDHYRSAANCIARRIRREIRQGTL